MASFDSRPQMQRLAHALLTGVVAACASASDRDALGSSETVVVPSGALRLRGALCRPQGAGPFPAVLFLHGSGRPTATADGQRDQRNRLQEPGILGPIFAEHGYVLLYLFRRGAGLSVGQGTASGDVMDGEPGREQGIRNRLQLELLETDEMDDALSGLALLRSLPDVDPRRIAVVGHSFGGSLALLLAERDPSLRAVVDFAGAAGSWENSPPLRERLLAAADDCEVPIFFVYAANDYSTAPGLELGAAMARLAKPHRLRVYPATGTTPEDGHRLVFRDIAAWEEDVFSFLDERVK